MAGIGLAYVAASIASEKARVRDSALRDYSRWEYGTPDPTHLIVSARRTTPRRPHRTLGRRLRYWLNSFRGFAAFDVRKVDDRVRD